jgi:uncharacterized glyoxalase superfamily protein PhnB
MSAKLGSAELARGWIEAWKRMDMDWLRLRLAPDFIHVSPFGRFEERDAYLEAIEPMARKSVTQLSIRGVVATGDQAAIRFDNTTPQGTVESCDWLRVEDGVIQEIRSFYDSATIRRVLSPAEQATLDSSPSEGLAAAEPPGLSAPPPPGYSRVCPYLNYEDTEAMLGWLPDAFGLVELHRVSDGNAVTHAEMGLGEAVVMMGTPGKDFRNPRSLGRITQSLYVFVDDVDAHCARARAAGAEIIEEPADQPYGHRRYGALDPEGHRWYFAADVGGAGGRY